MKDDTQQANSNAEIQPAKKLSFMERHKEKMRQFELRQQAKKEAFKERQKQNSEKHKEKEAERKENEVERKEREAEKYKEREAERKENEVERKEREAEKYKEREAERKEKEEKRKEEYRQWQAEHNDFCNNPDREPERAAQREKIGRFFRKIGHITIVIVVLKILYNYFFN